MFVNASNCRVFQLLRHTDLSTSQSGNCSTTTQVGAVWSSAVMRVIGVLVRWISARPGGQIAYDDHLTRWLAGTTVGIGRVCACERTGGFASVHLCVLERVKWAWIAISSVSSFRRVYWHSIHIHIHTHRLPASCKAHWIKEIHGTNCRSVLLHKQLPRTFSYFEVYNDKQNLSGANFSCKSRTIVCLLQQRGKKT